MDIRIDRRSALKTGAALAAASAIPAWAQSLPTLRFAAVFGSDLPENAKAYIAGLGKILGRPVEITSVGPDRAATMFAPGASWAPPTFQVN